MHLPRAGQFALLPIPSFTLFRPSHEIYVFDQGCEILIIPTDVDRITGHAFEHRSPEFLKSNRVYSAGEMYTDSQRFKTRRKFRRAVDKIRHGLSMSKLKNKKFSASTDSTFEKVDRVINSELRKQDEDDEY